MQLADILLLLTTLAASASPTLAQSGLTPPIDKVEALAPYEELNNLEGPYLDLVLAPIRPMEIDFERGRLYALNGHTSTVHELTTSGQLIRVHDVPWGPVSLAPWFSSGETPSFDYLLVVCRGTHTLARLHLPSGEIDALVELPTEPADIVVHPHSNHAFVSCSGAGVVVEVDVARARIVRQYPIASKEPTFLALRGPAVLVAPMFSGNNSTVETGQFVLDAGPNGVLDLTRPSIALEGLPDHDLFQILPGTEAEPLARGLGAVQFGLAVQPGTQEIWQLSTDGLNKDPALFGEPALRGDFIRNQLARVRPPTQAAGIVEPVEIINLDDSDRITTGIQFDPARTVGQPYHIWFDETGSAYIVGLLTDNVTQLDPSGSFVREWDVGSIPRMVITTPSATHAWVYCWGSSTVETYALGATPVLANTISLGVDPTPEREATGRRLYYSAAFSEHNNASCNSCHIEGNADFLAWDLSGVTDNKGPLVTQFLRGIEETAPYHWRGERAEFSDFNSAFEELLGGDRLTEGDGSEFEALEAFVFSMVQPANPNQHPLRLLDATAGITDIDGTHYPGDATRGQQTFLTEPSSGMAEVTCGRCHMLPIGTAGDIFPDEPLLQDQFRNHFVIASFNAIWRKEQPSIETITLTNGGIERRPTLGVGTSATGLRNSVRDFINDPIFIFDDQQVNDVAAFVNQFDSGLAPAVHRAWLLQAGDAAESDLRMIEHYLLPQAALRSCDIAVVGQVMESGTRRELRWFWDRRSETFLSEDSTVPAQTLEYFAAQAYDEGMKNIFLGLPVGMAQRWAVDFDLDGLFNIDELGFETNPDDPDTDSDGYPDGHEVVHNGDPRNPGIGSDDQELAVISSVEVVYDTAHSAKLLVNVSEPVRAFAIATAPGESHTSESRRLLSSHSLLFTGLSRDTPYDVTVIVRDPANNQTSELLPAALHTSVFLAPHSKIINHIDIIEHQDSGGVLDVSFIATCASKDHVPAADQVLILRVYVNGVLSQDHVQAPLESGPDGRTTARVTQSGLLPGDEVTLAVKSLIDVGTGSTIGWDMPSTDPEERQRVLVYTGTGP